MVQVQKAIRRIIIIKKLISINLKQVWTCIWYKFELVFGILVIILALKKDRSFYPRNFSRLDSNEKIAHQQIYQIIKKTAELHQYYLRL